MFATHNSTEKLTLKLSLHLVGEIGVFQIS